MVDERKSLPEFIANITDNVIIEVIKSGDVLFFNDKAACVFIGISCNGNLLKILCDEDASVLKRNFDIAFYHQYPHHFYHKINGRFYLIYMYPLDATIWISMLDITEKRQQSHLLYINAQRIKFSEKNIKFGYWELDTTLKRFYWSEEMYSIFGINSENLTYKKNLIRELIHPEDIDIYKYKLRELVSDEHNVEGKIRIVSPNNGLKYCHFIAGIVYENGEAKIVGVFRDITETIEIEHRLLQEKKDIEVKNQAKSYFLAQASHDIKQPLQIINILASSFKNISPSKYKEVANDIYKITYDMIKYLDNIMDISKIDLGGFTFAPKVFNLELVLRTICNDYKIIAQQRKINLICKFKNIEIYQDDLLIMRILGNLVNNALKYAKSKVVVGNSSKCFWVIDDGCGIETNELKYIFKEFYQCDKGLEQATKGIGLGLSIVNKIVNIIGARIKVRSICGKYSAFVVYL